MTANVFESYERLIMSYGKIRFSRGSYKLVQKNEIKVLCIRKIYCVLNILRDIWWIDANMKMSRNFIMIICQAVDGQCVYVVTFRKLFNVIYRIFYEILTNHHA